MREILRSLRNQNNYSQSAVASYLGITRQMYNRYESGIADPSLKNIKKLCELYKISADVFLQNINSEKNEDASYEYSHETYSDMCVTSKSIPYGESTVQSNSNSLLAEMLKLIPLLQFNEQITLMSRLFSLIENQTSEHSTTPTLRTKKIKKIPDAEYNKYINSEECRKIRESSLSTIREMLKNDEW